MALAGAEIRESVMQEAGRLSADDVIVMPLARSALLQHDRDPAGLPVLTLYLRDKEIAWDDPRHFPFAQALASGIELRAGDCREWGALDWDEARPMLEVLVDEELLARTADLPAVQDRHDNRPMPSPLPPAPMTRPRTWMDPDSLMQALTGTALDLHWLEVVVPIFRTAHLFLDRDGRHVGEANAFPAAARTEVPTDWRGCPYAGNRYQSDKPMNMSALKAMRAHWRQMMALLLPIREAYLQRFPDAASGWTVAHVERLSVCVLALPSYLMLRCNAPVANGDLHPALSNLFRVTDGLRMVMHHMMFVPLHEPMHPPATPVTVDSILAYADRNFLFHSDHGVCAGPRFMVEDFLAVLLHGASPRSGFDAEVDPELAAAAWLIEPAMDYGLLGLQTFGAVFALWPGMARCYADLHALLAGDTAAAIPGAAPMAERFAGHFDALSHRSFLASEEWRSHRETVYDDMYAACAQGLGDPAAGAALSALVTGTAEPGDADAHSVLAQAAGDHFGPASETLASAFADTVMAFLRRARCIVRLASDTQSRTAGLLHRCAPAGALTLRDINLHNVLMGADQRSVPFLPDELNRLLGTEIHVDSGAITITRAPRHASTHSPAQERADLRAIAR